ncbi:MAG: hypothetical protein IT454_11265 [Planctomycetes bacterium]|nr:hypothetical protein [Planctomycetota bacterium]
MKSWTVGLALVFVVGSSAAAQEFIYATSRSTNPQLLTVDPATGTVLSSVAVTNEEALFGGLAFDGTWLWSIDGYNDGNSDRTFKIDPASGAGTIVGNTGQNWNFRCVEVHPLSGVVYASRDNQLYTLDTTTGAALAGPAITGATLDQLTSIAIDRSGACYGVDIGGTGLFRIQLATGAATHLGDLNLPIFVQDLAFDANGALWCITAAGDLYKVSVSTLNVAFQYQAGAWGGLAFSGSCPSPVSYCTVANSSNGCAISIQATGSASVSASSGFTLTASGVDALRTGLFFYAVSDPNFTPVAWGASGPSFLCVKTPTQRMNVQNSGGASGCSGSFSMDWNAFMAANPGALGSPRTAGARFDAQLWMRDPPSTKTTILSNGLTFEVCP